MSLIGPWAIQVCPVCNRVKEASMGCVGAHEASHKYAHTVRVVVEPVSLHRAAVDLLREAREYVDARVESNPRPHGLDLLRRIDSALGGSSS